MHCLQAHQIGKLSFRRKFPPDGGGIQCRKHSGHRGPYLLPLLCKKMTTRQAVLLIGALWGMAHAPLIYSGMNYGLNYVGAPYSGIAMMILFCMTIGIYMSFVTLKTNNCMYASIIHGAVNIIGETPIFISLSTQSVLLGPNPSGIIGMSVLLIGAILLLFKLPSHKMNS